MKPKTAYGFVLLSPFIMYVLFLMLISLEMGFMEAYFHRSTPSFIVLSLVVLLFALPIIAILLGVKLMSTNNSTIFLWIAMIIDGMTLLFLLKIIIT